MTVKIKTRVLSAETRISRKTNNPYTIVNFMDGAQIVNAMVKEGVPVDITPFEDHEITLDFNLKYGSGKIVAIRKVV